ncbi:MAG: CopG antitoxin of type toxin-antitoxin system [Acidobacteriota bacterium]|jgi:hypothetical protein|nr:CopG antitoxin of type toxin-antitoxin system [Acidobacteriota bacterium]
MKRRFAKLSKAEQEEVELEYHRMKPQQLDELLSKSKRYAPEAIRLPPDLIEPLKTIAELEGETDYQDMVRNWIEERLQQEARLALRLSPKRLPKKVAALKRQVIKKTSVQL